MPWLSQNLEDACCLNVEERIDIYTVVEVVGIHRYKHSFSSFQKQAGAFLQPLLA